MEPSVLLVDSDTGQADLLARTVERQRYRWQVKCAESVLQARDLLALHAFDAIVARHRLADGTAFDLADPQRSPSLLIGIEPGEEAVAARALRRGFQGYFVRDAAGRYLLALPRQIDRALRHRELASSGGEAAIRMARQSALLQAISRAHGRFVSDADDMPDTPFEGLLADFLTLTGSGYGFIAEIRPGDDGAPVLQMQTQAFADVACDDASRIPYAQSAAQELLFRNAETLSGAALRDGQPVIFNRPSQQQRDGSLPPAHPPLHAFLGIPVRWQGRPAAFVGLANAPGGYSQADIATLEPLAVMLAQLMAAGRSARERSATDERLRLSEARWRSMSELSSDWYWEQDTQFRFTCIEGDETRSDWLGISPMIGRTRWEAPALNLNESQWHAHQAVLRSHRTFQNFEMEFIGRDERRQWMSISGKPMFDADGVFIGYRGVGRNITERKAAEARIEWLAFYDDLTSLPNRRRLLDRLQEAQDDCLRIDRLGALLLLDLDNFKDLNDTLGPERSDRVLQIVASRLRGCVRPHDTVARLGGDEFVVLQEGLPADPETARAQAEVLAQTVLSALGQPYRVDDADVASTPSIGVVLFADRPCTVDELLQRAELAMYQAKADGRNTHCFFHAGMQEVVSARHRLEAELRQTLAQSALQVFYQPVVDRHGRAIGVEALARWPHAERGTVLPADFVPLAEQSGLIVPLGRLVLRTACEQLTAWSADARTRHLTIAVNVSAREFRHPGFVEGVLATLAECGADPGRLKLEITESLLLHDMQDTIAKMGALRARGIGLALDDFGTGYSSLSYLKRLPFDQLKIDQSFVHGILTDPHDAAVACTIIQLARSFGLTVVAEGVETEGQRDYLLANGCEWFQGYWFGRPVPVEALELKLDL